MQYFASYGLAGLEKAKTQYFASYGLAGLEKAKTTFVLVFFQTKLKLNVYKVKRKLIEIIKNIFSRRRIMLL